jgi:hypothetical protein
VGEVVLGVLDDRRADVRSRPSGDDELDVAQPLVQFRAAPDLGGVPQPVDEIDRCRHGRDDSQREGACPVVGRVDHESSGGGRAEPHQRRQHDRAGRPPDEDGQHHRHDGGGSPRGVAAVEKATTGQRQAQSGGDPALVHAEHAG